MSIKLTETAIKEVKKAMADQEDIESPALRVGVSGGGCSGFNYVMEFINNDDADPLNDDQLEFDGLNVVVDRKSLLFLEGTTIDFKEDINQRGFKFENPQAKKGCGCGQSFGV